jgi:Family of unknown function (DUF6491)
MKRLMQTLSLFVLAGLASTGCASTPAIRDAERLALYRNHSGQPVDGFQYYGRFSSWTPLGDSAIAIWVGPSRAWLLDLYGPCNDLDFANAISLTSNTGRVSARFDSVRVHQRGSATIPCRIKEIRPLNVKALRADEKAAREGQKAKAADGES